MKKILWIIAVLCCIFILSVNASAENTDTLKYINAITPETTIEEDIHIFGLNYSDYNVSGTNLEKLEKFYQDNGYSEQFVLFVAENYATPFTTYIYCYNPLFFTTDINVKLIITLNDEFTRDYNNLEIVKEDRTAGIICFKIENLFKLTDLVRKYKVEINHSGMKAFECTYITEYDTVRNRLDHVNYDSMIYILDDVVVPVILKSEKNLFGGTLGEAFTAISGKNPYDSSILYFYNFSASKRIDQILEADFRYDEHLQQGYYSKPLFSGLKFDGIDNKTTVDKTIENKVSNVKWYGQEISINPYMTPSKNRLSEFGEMANKFSQEEKKRFTDYEHSILINVETYIDSRNTAGEGFVNMYTIDNVRLTKLVYETDGVIYSSVVGDYDGTDTPVDPIIPIQKDFWDYVKDFLIMVGSWLIGLVGLTATDQIKAIVGGVFLLISFVFFPYIIKIILFPFKILKRLFKRK